ncbi:MAG: hypothetical protein ACR2G5_02860 [Pyrinomonadaceae bacterium]
MNNQPAKSTKRYVLIAVAFLLALATQGMAQPAPGPPPIDRTANPDRIRQQDMSKREYELRNFGNAPDGSSDQKQLKAVGAQIEQDFNRILILHNQIARATSSDQPLDYHFVSDATAEIKKRASRLQTTLALHEPTTRQQSSGKSTEFDDLKTSLFLLCKQIRSFVTNPVIETPGTVNAGQLSNARRDLESIIILSGHIRKNAVKLGP